MDESNLILLVDDNPDDQLLTIQALKESDINCDVFVVNDGVEALDYLFATGKYENRDINKMPKIILLDLKLPKVNGLEVLQQIKSNISTKLIPVIILSSSKEQQDLINSYSFGANSYICKPVDFNQFTDIICYIGKYWLSINEFPKLKYML
jgi:CheY-like chemotaxis protein